MLIKSLAALSCLALTLATIPQGWSSFIWGSSVDKPPPTRTLDPDLVDLPERCADVRLLWLDPEEEDWAEGRFIVITQDGEIIVLRCRED